MKASRKSLNGKQMTSYNLLSRPIRMVKTPAMNGLKTSRDDDESDALPSLRKGARRGQKLHVSGQDRRARHTEDRHPARRRVMRAL
jgi:hypothetical protein